MTEEERAEKYRKERERLLEIDRKQHQWLDNDALMRLPMSRAEFPGKTDEEILKLIRHRFW